jgi:hypothetical protein
MSKYQKHNLELATIREMIKIYNEGSMTQKQLCDKYNIPVHIFRYYKNVSKTQRGGNNPDEFVGNRRQTVQPTYTKQISVQQNTRGGKKPFFDTIDIVQTPVQPRTKDELTSLTLTEMSVDKKTKPVNKKVTKMTREELDKLAKMTSKELQEYQKTH